MTTKDLLDKNIRKLSKQIDTLPLGSSEQKVAVAELDKLLQRYTDLEKAENEHVKIESDRVIAEEKLHQESLSLDYQKEADQKKDDLERDKLKQELIIEKKRRTLELIKTGGTIAGTLGGSMIGMIAYRNLVAGVLEYEKTGVLSSTMTKSVIGLFKPKF